MQRHAFTVVLLATLAAALPAAADRVLLKNGDVLTGTARFLENMLEVKPDYADKVLIEPSQVVTVEFARDDRPATLDELKDDELKALVRTAPKDEEFAEAGAVYLLCESRTEVNRDGSFTTVRRNVFKILKERSKGLANVTISTYRDKETAEVLVARSIKPDGRLFYVKPDSIKITAQYGDYPLYDKKDILQFTIPEVKEGDILEVATKITSKQIDLTDPPSCSTYFRGVEPVLRSTVEFRLPDKVEGVRAANFKNLLFNFAGDTPEVLIERESGGGLSLRLTYGRADGMISEDYRPPLKDIVPRLKAALTTPYREIGREILHRLSKTARPTAATRAVIAELSAGAPDRLTLARRINEFVGFRVKRIGVPFFITDLVPTPPDAILQEKYGGAVDRIALLHALLESADFKPEYVLVRERGDGRMDTEIPTLTDFTDLLVRVKIDRTTWWLAPPSEFRPFGVLPQELQDAEGWLLAAEGGEALRTPFEPVEPELTRIRMDLALKASGDADFDQTESYFGSMGGSVRSGYKSVKPTEWEQNLRTMIESEVKGSRLDTLEVTDMNDLTSTVEVAMRYGSLKFADNPGEGRYLVFKLPFLAKDAGYVGKPERVYDLYLPFASKSDKTYSIRIPEGYEPYYVPPDLTIAHPLLDYARTFATEGGVIRFTERARTGGALLPKEKYPEFKGLVDKMATIEREWVILKKK